MTHLITGKLVDIKQKSIYPAAIHIAGGRIINITRTDTAIPENGYIVLGFIDSHVHIESSMLVPSEFAKLAVVHGTVATVSDPHEIANVCGLEGVAFMTENGKTVPFKFYFGAPSCVPATVFETSGATLSVAEVTSLLQKEEIKYLSEMMNFPGVLQSDPEVMQKIQAAHLAGKPVDGHAPGLRGSDAKKYIDAGISTDHECFTAAEALEKIQYGMKILIREGSAAKNFEALIDLLSDYPDKIMLCSDDKHPDSLLEGHINQLCARAVAKNIDVFKVLQAACINPIEHYNLEVGQLQIGDPADFIIVEDLQNFKVLKTFIAGEIVAENGRSRIKSQPVSVINNFHCKPMLPQNFIVPATKDKKIPVIEALNGQLITKKIFVTPKIVNGNIVSDIANDVLKIVVVNRYQVAPVAKAFIKNFGIKTGALASSVAHDSHNIVAVGVDDESICEAINLIIAQNGGISVVCPESLDTAAAKIVLPLPIAGLMSNEDGYIVAEKYTKMDKMVKQMGSQLDAPFMTISFMALLVIPELKLSDKGLFDGNAFKFTETFTLV